MSQDNAVPGTSASLTRHALVTGAAGFIGSQLVDRLLNDGWLVTGVDNFVRGSRQNLAPVLLNRNFQLIEVDVADLDDLRKTITPAIRRQPVTLVWHMAANSDIAAGVADARVDLRDTFITTFNTLEVMREFRIQRIAFASTSAVYGDLGVLLTEDTGPLFPISNYGAMKLASEGLISAAVESYLDRAWIMRFPNVIGPPATHGIIFDLMKKLAGDPPDLEVLGDGKQQKPYLHISELIEAMLFVVANATNRLNCYNIGPPDEGVTVRAIAEAVRQAAAPAKPIRYTGISKGWVGDVPRFRYSIEKLSRLGWRPRYTSAEAMQRAISEVYEQLRVPCNS
jgi:UDP-glucose 4-epimerase